MPVRRFALAFGSSHKGVGYWKKVRREACDLSLTQSWGRRIGMKPESECDVSDHERLTSYRRLRAPERRARGDQVHSRVLAAIARRLSGPTISSVRAHRNKVISHAASHSSRAGLKPLALSLASIDSAHRSLLEATEALSVILLGEIMIGGPVPHRVRSERMFESRR